MPTYVYKFEDGTIEEVEQSIHDDPFAIMYHPELNVPQAVTRVPQPAMSVFKGSGWARK